MDLIRSGDESAALLQALMDEAGRHPKGDTLADVV